MVLDYWRCAMLPLRDEVLETGRPDDVNTVGTGQDPTPLEAVTAAWELGAMRAGRDGPFADRWRRDKVAGGRRHLVSAAPELARLTLNIAAAHHDARATGTGRRLVYGGHTVGIAAGHVAQALPELATIVAWEHCDHLAPVLEGDTLYSDVTLAAVDGHLLTLDVEVRAVRGEEVSRVLDWRLRAVHP